MEILFETNNELTRFTSNFRCTLVAFNVIKILIVKYSVRKIRRIHQIQNKMLKGKLTILFFYDPLYQFGVCAWYQFPTTFNDSVNVSAVCSLQQESNKHPFESEQQRTEKKKYKENRDRIYVKEFLFTKQ